MPVPVIHQTDYFRPHNDPDDHWDVACEYALAMAGDIELAGIVIDFPPPHHRGDPDVCSLAQLNFITSLHVPFSVGAPHSAATVGKLPASLVEESNAVRMVLATLERATTPVVIHLAGSCRDIARAGIVAPDLFREKCAGIYLNAGTGARNVEVDAELEYNVRLDPFSFKAIWDIPCPVFWLPCFEMITEQIRVSEFGAWFDFLQAEILLHLSDNVQKYFAFMFGKIQDTGWLDYLQKEKDQALLARHAQMRRNMWCTAGFFHAAGKTVTVAGNIVSHAQAPPDPVFTFDPIDMRCDDSGITRWTPATFGSDRYIFHVRDLKSYRQAMATAMCTLLMTLP